MPPSAWQPGYEQSYVASPHDLHRRQSKAPNPTALLSWQTRHDAVRKPMAASDDKRKTVMLVEPPIDGSRWGDKRGPEPQRARDSLSAVARPPRMSAVLRVAVGLFAVH